MGQLARICFILGTVAFASALAVPGGGRSKTTAERREDAATGNEAVTAGVEEDNVADSSMTSYSSVVIHHPGGRGTSRWSVGKKELAQPPSAERLSASHVSPNTVDPNDQEARSESYFKVFTPSAQGRVAHSYFPRSNPQQEAGIQEVEPPSYHQKQTPSGMSEQLMSTLLKQQPQTFDATTETWANLDLQKTKTEPPKPTEKKKEGKKRGSKRPDSFNVGYSIGFGQAKAEGLRSSETHQDVVVGKPKPFRIHVQGTESVWKELEPGVEMSQEIERRQPYRPQHQHQQGVFYLHNGLKEIADQGHYRLEAPHSFDHAHALGQSNTFDFSNAVGHEIGKAKSLQGFPQTLDYHHHSFPQSLPYHQLEFPKTYYHQKQPVVYNVPQAPVYKNIDIPTTLYTTGSLGLNSPVPIQNVYIPGKHGEGRMVQAIVIPISQIQGLEGLYGGYNHHHHEPVSHGLPLSIHNTVHHGGPVPLNNVPVPVPVAVPVAVQGGQQSPEPTTSRPHTRPNGFGTKLNRHQSKGQGASGETEHHSQVPRGKPAPSAESYGPKPSQIQPPEAYRARSPAQLHREQLMLNHIMAQEMIRKNNPARSVVQQQQQQQPSLIRPHF